MLHKNKTQLIFITGLPRCGSTWASKTISKGIRSRLIHEPFNWRRYPNRLSYHMKYLPIGSSDQGFIKIIKNLTKTTPLKFFRNNFFVIKDVHTCLAVELIWEVFHAKVLILLRHPCAMGLSWSQLDLKIQFRIERLLAQNHLIEAHLSPFVSHLNTNNPSYFFRFGSYWGAVYYVLDRIAKMHPEWQFVTHETLCKDPENQFRILISSMGGNIQPSQINKLNRYLDRNNRKKYIEKAHSTIRNTSIEPLKWKERLTTRQIEDIFAGCMPFGVLEKYFGKSR